MSVELEVRLVGDDPEQTSAFNGSGGSGTGGGGNAFTTALDEVLNAQIPKTLNEFVNEISAFNASLADGSAFQAALDEVLSAQGIDQNPEATVINSIDELIKKIEELLTNEKKGGAEKETKAKTPEGELAKFFDKLDAAIQSKIEGFGLDNTSAGRVVSRASKTVKNFGTKLANSKPGKFVAESIFGRTAAAGAGAAEGAAAGAGAAGAAGVSIGAVAGPIAAVALAAAGTAITLKVLTDAVQAAANELIDLSPELAATRAQFEVNRELARLGRAERIGAGAAQLEAARSRISDSMYEVQTKILELILKFSPLLEQMLDGVNVGVRSVDVIIATINDIWAQVNQIFDPTNLAWQTDGPAAQAELTNSLGELAKAMNEMLKDGPPQNGNDPWLMELFKIDAPGIPPKAPLNNRGLFP